jgi:hypothetical protein
MEAFLNAVIPPSSDGRMPGAGVLGVAAELAGAIEGDVRLGPLVQAGLLGVYQAAIERDPHGLPALSAPARVEVIQGQLAAHPVLMMGVARHLYPAYYQHPRVLEGLGEPARPPFPEGYDVEPTDPRLLDRLRQRQRR